MTIPVFRSSWNSLAGTDAQAERDVASLCRWLVIGLCSLIFVTRALWLPQTSYPQIPFFAVACHVPLWGDAVLLVMMLIASGSLFFAISRNRLAVISLIVMAFTLSGLIVLNQQRLQPWAYQMVLICVLLSLLPSRSALASLRLLTISIYVWSAVSKCDASFLQTHGEVLVTAFLTALRIPPASLPAFVVPSLTVMLPLGELLVAMTLCFRRTRTTGLVFGVLLHGALLITLSPWGLNHRPGVLVWNVFFIGLLGILFRRRAFSVDVEPVAAMVPLRGRERFGFGVLSLAVCLPVLQPWGLFDAWPSWAVYASQPERMTVFVTSSSRDRLPPELRRQTRPVLQTDDWHQLRMDHWSLETLAAPLPPSTRVQMAVAHVIATQFDLGEGIEIELQSASGRFNGRRTTERIKGRDAIGEKRKSYRLNTIPRGSFSLESPDSQTVAF